MSHIDYDVHVGIASDTIDHLVTMFPEGTAVEVIEPWGTDPDVKHVIIGPFRSDMLAEDIANFVLGWYHTWLKPNDRGNYIEVLDDYSAIDPDEDPVYAVDSLPVTPAPSTTTTP